MFLAPLSGRFRGCRAPFLLATAVGLGCAARPAPKPLPTTSPLATQDQEVDPVARAAEKYAASVREAMARRGDKSAPATFPVQIEKVDPRSWLAPDGLSLAAAPQEVRPAAAPVSSIAKAPVVNFPATAPAGLALAAINEPSQGSDRGEIALVAPPAVPPAESLDVKLLRTVRSDPTDLSNQLSYQLALFAEGKPVPDLAAAASLPAEDRSTLLAVLDGLSNFRAAAANPAAMPADKVRPLTDMADRLRERSDLSVPTAVLCSKVDGFGRYDPIDPPVFRGPAEHPVVLYCEVDHFTSKLAAGGQWAVKLTWDTALYDESGRKVWTGKATEVDDESRNRRRDFFAAKVLRLPGSLAAGRYLLKVTIVDRQAERVAERSVPLQIIP